jgi:2-phosphoglycerate kinase
MPLAHKWQVLLIGGSTGVGKTRLARSLSQRFGVPLLLVDDIRMAIQSVTTSEQLPDLHYFLSRHDIWDQPPETLVEGWLAVARSVSKALETVIAHHLVVEGVGPIMIEGDGILPSLAAMSVFAWSGPVAPGKVRSLFIYEDDKAVLLENMRTRGRGFDAFTPVQQINFARAAAMYGKSIQKEALSIMMPCLPCHPWESLEERALECLHMDAAE